MKCNTMQSNTSLNSLQCNTSRNTLEYFIIQFITLQLECACTFFCILVEEYFLSTAYDKGELFTVYDRGVLSTDTYGRCELSAVYDKGELSTVYDRGELSTVYDRGVLSTERENANDHISLDTSSLGACHHNNYVGLLCNTLREGWHLQK